MPNQKFGIAMKNPVTKEMQLKMQQRNLVSSR